MMICHSNIKTVKVKKITATAKIPKYSSPFASGADLYADLGGSEETVWVDPGDTISIPTGISLEIPIGLEGQIRPRSGKAYRHNITVLNTPGTIDCDYRGEIRVLIINLGRFSVTINHADRIAQLVIAPIVKADFNLVKKLSKTNRGSNGFGSTGG